MQKVYTNNLIGKNPIRRISQGPFLWLIPLILFLAVFFLYPAIDVIRLSFTNAKMASLDYRYTLDSYKRVLSDPSFIDVLRVTFIFVAISVIFQFVLGYIIALAVDKGEKQTLKGTVVARTIALISWAIPGVAIGIIWKLLLDESPAGIINYALSLIHMKPISFLTTPQNALISISIANIWRGTAQSMILLYAGLKTVPNEMLESANVDGANGWTKLIRIIMPSMRSVIMINILLNIVNTFNTFDMIISMTGGGPGRSTEVLVLSSYRTIFQQLDLGKGSAIAVLLLLINIFSSALYIKLYGKDE